MVCNDGFSISIRDHFCTPRDDIGPYEYVETAYPSEWEDLLLPFTDNNTDRTPVICGEAPTLYVNVPAKVIREMINKHGGMARRSGHLPRMVEFDSNGYQWTEAAVPPTDSETTMEDDEDVEVGMDSPTSAAHVGAPPPLPPPPPATTGALTPPPPVTASPIETIHEDFF